MNYQRRSRALLVMIVAVLSLAACRQQEPTPPAAAVSQETAFARPAGAETFTAIISGTRVGQMDVQHGDVTNVGYEYRNNGRGPSVEEVIEFNDQGLPSSWHITGATTFGNIIAEDFEIEGGRAVWTDTTGASAEELAEANLYVAQESSPYALWVYARLLLAAEGNTLAVLPAGELKLDAIESLDVTGSDGASIAVTTYALSGIDLNPSYFALDEDGLLFASMSERFALVRTGFEAEEQRLRDLAAEYATRRFETIQEQVTRVFDKPVRINNVRVFDPDSLNLSEPVSVLVAENRIASIDDVTQAPDADEILIDGAGGTLVAGMYEMHAHAGQGSALLNIAAGVTSFRDMGNNNEVLDDLINKIESGRLVGPRIHRSGFIEGRSPFNSNSGILVSTQEEALDAVRWYADQGDFHQIKIYNSMTPEWVPAMVTEAHDRGLRVAGHVPAFTNADAMIAAGYDELTHINQVMLGWVLAPDEDTRTLLRLTAMKRFPAIDINSDAVQSTISSMGERGMGIDPTLAIHENLMLSRNGEVAPGMVDYIDNMPVGIQRNARTARSEIASPEDDIAYRQGFAKILETVREMRDQGVVIIPGTDLGGSFSYHRELELYQEIGMTAAEVLKMATLDMASYLGQDDELGSIEQGKLADFFLVPGDPTTDLKAIKTISMVVKDGNVYFPSDIYPEFGIQPFTDAPVIVSGAE
ncbi:amidohydrolase [Pseudohongiella acticola]|uniref:Amidohydrolase n=1 Tax=Pseudohongiella acticola TaxID=1524254 RepID=A0A1E8CK28_9GAMM|nr:amidohydrolase family protein [Pseudohongiella acticola]OFE12764.1 amidohydrolase [Pseudohongiella acticola]